jgi:hypothetical protein
MNKAGKTDTYGKNFITQGRSYADLKHLLMSVLKSGFTT